MSFKLFIHTADGDEQMMEFDTGREKAVFEDIVRILKEDMSGFGLIHYDDNNRKVLTTSLKTTLQGQVLQMRTNIVRDILGIEVVNMYWSNGKPEVTLIKYRPEE